MRQQGFLALARTAPGSSPATRELTFLALLEDAETLFNTTTLQRIRAFLEGYIAIERPSIKTPTGPSATRELQQLSAGLAQNATPQQSEHPPKDNHEIAETNLFEKSEKAGNTTLPKTGINFAGEAKTTTNIPIHSEPQNLFQAAVALAKSQGTLPSSEEASEQRSGTFMNLFSHRLQIREVAIRSRPCSCNPAISKRPKAIIKDLGT